MAGLVLDHLSKAFNAPGRPPVQALDGINLTLEPGELLAVLGPSGSGKTTLLRLVAGLETPAAGRILFDGEDLTGIPAQARGVAMLFQEPSLYPHMTVAENLGAGLRWRKMAAPEIDLRVRKVAERLQLTACLDRLPETLSGGQQQRVALGRTLVLRPRMLLLDEPLTHLDPALRLEMRREIARLNRELGVAVIYVTHDQAEAMALGRRIAILRAGRLQQCDRPLALYQRPANLFVAGFLGHPPMARFEGMLMAEGETLQFHESTAEGAPGFRVKMPESNRRTLQDRAGKRLILGLRPEHIVAGSEADAAQPPVGAIVEAVEPLGGETLLWLKTAGHSFATRVNSSTEFHVNDPIRLSFRLEHARFFDPVTHAAL